MRQRERSFRVEAVVLRHSDWGEADRLLWLYSREKGKIRATAKGVRKMRSRKAGHLEPFTRVSLQLARARDFPIVTQAEALDVYLTLREDLLRVGYAAYITELLDRFTYEDDENQSLYRLLTDTLARLNTDLPPALVARYYEIWLLDALGYRPQLFHCVKCESEIQPEDQYFSIPQGGVLCPKCGLDSPEAVSLRLPVLKVMRHFQRSPFADVAHLRISPDLDRQLETLMQNYLTYILERGLNSPAFLRHVRAS